MSIYPMTNKRKIIQIDCRNTTCNFCKEDGDCTNPAPAITLNPNGEYVCWSEQEDVEPMIIKKKCHPEFFEKVLSGEKKFEVRLADFECSIGDRIILREYDPKTQRYTGRRLSRKVTYIIKTKDLNFWTKEDAERYGYQIMSLEDEEEEDDGRIHCSNCGKTVSTPVPTGTVIRAWIECPECLEASAKDASAGEGL